MLAGINVRSFGPIDEGNIEPRSLTVFTGANNSGKSYLGALLYAIHRASPVRRQPLRLGGPTRRRRDSWSSELLAETSAVLLELRVERRSEEVRLPPSLYDYFAARRQEILRDYAAAVADAIETAFGASLTELVRVPSRPYHGFRLRITGPRHDWTVRLSLSQGNRRITAVAETDIGAILNPAVPRALRAATRVSREIRAESFLDELENVVLMGLFQSWPRSVYYLPAARSGVLQSQRLLVTSWMQEASRRIGFEEITLPRMAGISVDFINALFGTTPRRVTDLADVAEYIQEAVLGGGVSMEGEPPAAPEITYHQGEVSLPVHRASSMVSELAPVVLFIRHLLGPGGFLVIEEPEAHLHPRMQAALARAIAMLVARGVYVLVTTHSEFFLTQLNNILLEGVLQARKSSSEGSDNGSGLSMDRVIAYRFNRDGWQGGTNVEEMEVTPEAGIVQDDFAEVAEGLYAESVQLDRRLQGLSE